jgi:hypothetical protein
MKAKFERLTHDQVFILYHAYDLGHMGRCLQSWFFELIYSNVLILSISISGKKIERPPGYPEDGGFWQLIHFLWKSYIANIYTGRLIKYL